MKIKCIYYCLLSLLLLTSSCASIPKESIDLTAKLNQQLIALEDANALLINQIYVDKYCCPIILYMIPCDESVWDTVKIDGNSLEEVLQDSYIVNIS